MWSSSFLFTTYLLYPICINHQPGVTTARVTREFLWHTGLKLQVAAEHHLPAVGTARAVEVVEHMSL
jgi:hypothetical protein